MNPSRKPRHLVILSGAGMSAESGLQTFRGAGGLWEGHRVETVATPQAWAANRELVLRFYNHRRQQLRSVHPNAGHEAIARLESELKVSIVTQNVDDLHERAGSTNVIHLHGELKKARSTLDPSLVYDLGERDIELGDTCERGSQLRPHIVWFGESVPEYSRAEAIVRTADILIVVGTSLAVYPAAYLAECALSSCECHVINPEIPSNVDTGRFHCITDTAANALPILAKDLLQRFGTHSGG